MHLKGMDTVFHDHLENRHFERRHFVRDTHSGILSIDDGCRRDTNCVLKVGGGNLGSRLPKGGRQELSRLTCVKRPGLTSKNLAGIAHCERIMCREKKILRCTSFHELLTFRLRTGRKTGIIAAFLALNLVGSGVSVRESICTEFLSWFCFAHDGN